MNNTNAIVPTQRPRPASHGLFKHRTLSLIGAGVGTVVFLAIGLLPTLVYGGVASVQLVSGFSTTSGAPNAGFILLGIVFAVTLVGSLFAALGAVAGASVGALTRAAPVQP